MMQMRCINLSVSLFQILPAPCLSVVASIRIVKVCRAGRFLRSWLLHRSRTPGRTFFTFYEPEPHGQSSAWAVETAPAVSFCHSSSPPLRLSAEPEFHAPRIPT